MAKSEKESTAFWQFFEGIISQIGLACKICEFSTKKLVKSQQSSIFGGNFFYHPKLFGGKKYYRPKLFGGKKYYRPKLKLKGKELWKLDCNRFCNLTFYYCGFEYIAGMFNIRMQKKSFRFHFSCSRQPSLCNEFVLQEYTLSNLVIFLFLELI